MTGRGTNTLQTLDRGLQALALIAQTPHGLTIAELAEALKVHRAIVYRLVSTLEGHRLVARAPGGQICLGVGVVALAAQFEPHLGLRAQPLLHRLARATRATAFISAAQGSECVVLMVAEPEEGLLRVAYRVGSRHPLSRGAAGIAILAGRPERPDDPEEVRQARRDGFSVTRGQLQPGAVGVASPIRLPAHLRRGFEASIGVVAIGELDLDRAAVEVRKSAAAIAGLIQGGGDPDAGTGDGVSWAPSTGP